MLSCWMDMEIVEMELFHLDRVFVLLLEVERILEELEEGVIVKMMEKRLMVVFECKVVEMLVNVCLVVFVYMEVGNLVKGHLEVFEKMVKEFLEVLD